MDTVVAELCALGILVARQMSWHLLDDEGDVVAVFTSEEAILSDWRIAGALIQKTLDMGKGIKIYPESDVKSIIRDAMKHLDT